MSSIRDSIKKIADSKQYFSELATVSVVNENTCDVVLVKSGLELFDVRLSASDGVGILLEPVIDSFVIVTFLDKYNAFISQTSALELITIQTENESLKLILSDLLDAITQMTVTTPIGVSGTPVNFSSFTDIKMRLDSLLKN